MNKRFILFNIRFWLIYFLYEWLTNGSYEDDYRRYFFNALVIVPIAFAASLVTVHVLIEKFYLKNKKKIFWIGFIISVFLFIVIRHAYNFFYTYPRYYPESVGKVKFWLVPKLIFEGVAIYLIVGAYTMFYFIRAWYEQQRISAVLKQEKISSELELLKSQVHPHFIFNTLNNIYSLAVMKNEKTPEMIHRLSALLS